MGSSVTFNDKSGGVEARVHAALARAGSDVVEFLLEDSNRTVPIEEGVLEGLGTAEFDASTLTGSITYDGPYAARQHEETTWRHDPGRRAKWLELTLLEQDGRARDHVAGEVRKELA